MSLRGLGVLWNDKIIRVRLEPDVGVDFGDREWISTRIVCPWIFKARGIRNDDTCRPRWRNEGGVKISGQRIVCQTVRCANGHAPVPFRIVRKSQPWSESIPAARHAGSAADSRGTAVRPRKAGIAWISKTIRGIVEDRRTG